METHQLVAHPAHPPRAVTRVEARVIGRDADWLRLRWRIEGTQALVVPPFAGRGRADGLWRTTCFEAFVRPDGGDAYSEYNFSPSERWAAYDFDAPRQGQRDRAVPHEPTCTLRQGSSFAIFDAALPAGALPHGPAALALTAVIEEEGGTLSYWALSHGAPAPDFHDPACFALRLAAPAGR